MSVSNESLQLQRQTQSYLKNANSRLNYAHFYQRKNCIIITPLCVDFDDQLQSAIFTFVESFNCAFSESKANVNARAAECATITEMPVHARICIRRRRSARCKDY